MTLAEKFGGMEVHKAARAIGIKFSEDFVPASTFVTANGMKLHYLDWGNHGKPKLLCLHGGAQTAHSWDFFALGMRDQFHIVALDQRGHGDSDWSQEGDYSLESHVKDVDAFTDAIGFKQFVLVGLSMGGRNSYGFTYRHPAKVKSLIICDIGPETNKAGTQRIGEFLQDTEVFESFDWLVKRVQKYNPHREEKQIRGSLLNNLKQLPDGRWTWKYDRRRGLRQRGGGEITVNLWAELKSIKCPTLLVRGGNSDVLTPETAKKVAATIPNCKLVEVPNAGHLVQGDNPVAFEKAVRGFLGAPGKV